MILKVDVEGIQQLPYKSDPTNLVYSKEILTDPRSMKLLSIESIYLNGTWTVIFMYVYVGNWAESSILRTVFW